MLFLRKLPKNIYARISYWNKPNFGYPNLTTTMTLQHLTID